MRSVQQGMGHFAQRTRFPTLVALVVGLAGSCASLAGTVEVVLRDENGAPVAHERVAVHAPGQEPQGPGSMLGRQVWSATTDPKGIAVLEGLPPGPYTATVHPRAPGLVPPLENPFAPVPTVTLAPDTQRVRLEVELWHGSPVVLRIDVQRGKLERVRVRAREIDHGFPLERSLPVGSDEDWILAPGRWELAIDPPPGYLLVGLETDGRPVEGHVASVEPAPYASASFVTWRLIAPATLGGHVYFDGPRTAVQVLATLREPGAWIEAASRRGGSRFDAVTGAPEPMTGEYELELPDGRWELTVIGDGVVAVDPERVERVVPAGSVEVQDFRVLTEEEEAQGLVFVTVEDPDGERIAGATVEVWPADPADRGEAPVARKETESYGMTYIRGLAEGSYILAAGHPRFIEGRAELAGYDPEDDESVQRRVRLRPAATVHAFATDSDDEAVSGVSLRMSRVDRAPDALISEPGLVAAMSEAHTVTDATGHAWIEGVWPGTYEIAAEPGARGQAGRFVRFRDEADLVLSLQLRLLAGEKREIGVEILPAASFALRLQCDVELALPGTISAAVLPAPADAAGDEDGSWIERAVLRLDDVPLTGSPRDRLLVGPLDQDAYHLAVRPAGHERWTWVMGTELLEDAAMLQAIEDEPTELGTLQIDCGPAIRLVPRTATGQPLPDLASVAHRSNGVTISGTVVRNGTKRIVKRAKVDPYRDTLVLRRLPEGEAELEVALSHPYFVPRVVRVPVVAQLERGRTELLEPVIPAVGGAIRVEPGEAIAGRIIPPRGEPRLERSQEGRLVFENLAPGRYRVELCDDEGCESVARVWDGVDVVALSTVKLP